MSENPYEAPTSPTPARREMRRSLKIGLIVLCSFSLLTVAGVVALFVICTGFHPVR